MIFLLSRHPALSLRPPDDRPLRAVPGGSNLVPIVLNAIEIASSLRSSQ
jgi:hypothetical protein